MRVRSLTTAVFVDDDDDYRAGLQRLLEESGRYAVVGSFRDIGEAESSLVRQPAQVALVGVDAPGLDGAGLVARLQRASPAMRVAIITMFDDSDRLFAALVAGAAGYVLKNASPTEILPQLDELIAGGAVMSRPVARRIINAFGGSRAPWDGSGISGIERDILDLCVRGLDTGEIGFALAIAPAAVRVHISAIFQKVAMRLTARRG